MEQAFRGSVFIREASESDRVRHCRRCLSVPINVRMLHAT